MKAGNKYILEYLRVAEDLLQEEESDDSEDRKTAPKNEAKTKVKAASKDLSAKGGAIKGGAIKGRVVKGGGAKGGAMKGRPAAMKK